MKEILITSTVLILAILLIRWILRKRVSKRLIYATWLLVAIRLLIPFQFGQSDFSVVAVAERLEQHSESIQQFEQTLQQPVSFDREESPRNDLFNTEYPAPTQSTQAIIPQAQTPSQSDTAAAVSAPTPQQLLKGIWITGIIGMIGWFSITNLLFLIKAKRSAEVCKDIVSPIPIRISPNVATPCLAGLIRPVIYLTPSSCSDPQKQEHVLTHELTHLRHWDHIWSWVRCLCLCIYWFHPLVWVAAIVSKRDCELACDEAALKKLGDSQRIAYGKTLLDTVTHSPVRIFQAATAMSESKKQLKERVNFIVRKPKHLWIAAIALIVAVTLTAGFVFSGCKQNEPTPTEPSTSTSTSTTSPTQNSTGSTKPNDTQDPIPDFSLKNPIAEEMITKYTQYKATGIWCDFELVVEDMSQHLTADQKESYYGQQYRLLCCHTADEVVSHIDRHLAKNLWDNDPTDRLFTVGEDLYLIILPTEYISYGSSYGYWVTSANDNFIKAEAYAYDEDGVTAVIDYHIDRTGDHPKITDVRISTPPPHNHDYEVTTIAPTCAEEGYDMHKCKLCGYYYCDNFVPRLEHDYETITVDPTCTDQGYTLRQCACGDSRKENFKDPIGHNYRTNDDMAMDGPSTIESGYCYMTCKNCGDTYKKILVASEAIDLKALIAECEDYARSLGFNVVPSQTFDYPDFNRVSDESIATSYLCLGVTDPKDNLKDRVINHINRLHKQAKSSIHDVDEYYLCISINLRYSASLTNTYYIRTECGLPN